MKAIGLVEMPHLTDAVEALDVMLKTADITFLTWEKKLGGRLVTIIIQGEVSAVKEAVAAAHQSGAGKIAASAVIANPHEETMKMVNRSMEKLFKKKGTQVQQVEAAETFEDKENKGKKKKKEKKEIRENKEKPAENIEGGIEDGVASIGNGGDEGSGSVD